MRVDLPKLSGDRSLHMEMKIKLPYDCRHGIYPWIHYQNKVHYLKVIESLLLPWRLYIVKIQSNNICLFGSVAME